MVESKHVRTDLLSHRSVSFELCFVQWLLLVFVEVCMLVIRTLTRAHLLLMGCVSAILSIMMNA